MDINSAINVINGSDRTPNEKNHFKRLVFAGKLVPNAFNGIPIYDQILEIYPIEGISIYLILIIVPHSKFCIIYLLLL
jgi:hypothetical protein